MRNVLAAIVVLGLTTFVAMPAKAGAPAPAPAAAPVGQGSLFVESEEGGASKLVLSGLIDTRFDTSHDLGDFDNSSARNYHEYINTRAQLGFLFQLNENVDVFLMPQVGYVWGGSTITRDGNGDDAVSAAGNDDLRIYQAYVALRPQVAGLNPVFKVGRQEISLGSEMLVGDNTRYEGLSFDAVRADVQLFDGLTTSVFGAKVVENDQAYINGMSADISGNDPADVYLFGLWNTYNALPDTTIDVYGLLFQAERGVAAATVNSYNGVGLTEQDLYTVGARLAINPIELAQNHAFDFDFSVEGAAQFGTLYIAGTENDVTGAYALESELGLTLGAMPWTPRLAIGTALASGDDDPASDVDHTFHPLFEDTTNRLGDADLVSLSNVKSWYLKGSVKPAEKLEVGATYLRFEAMHVETAVGGGNYTQPGNGAGAFAAAAGLENDVADELDVFADLKLTKNVGLRGVYAFVDPSEFIDDKAGFGNSPGSRFFASLVVKW